MSINTSQCLSTIEHMSYIETLANLDINGFRKFEKYTHRPSAIPNIYLLESAIPRNNLFTQANAYNTYAIQTMDTGHTEFISPVNIAKVMLNTSYQFVRLQFEHMHETANFLYNFLYKIYNGVRLHSLRYVVLPLSHEILKILITHLYNVQFCATGDDKSLDYKILTQLGQFLRDKAHFSYIVLASTDIIHSKSYARNIGTERNARLSNFINPSPEATLENPYGRIREAVHVMHNSERTRQYIPLLDSREVSPLLNSVSDRDFLDMMGYITNRVNRVQEAASNPENFGFFTSYNTEDDNS